MEQEGGDPNQQGWGQMQKGAKVPIHEPQPDTTGDKIGTSEYVNQGESQCKQ